LGPSTGETLEPDSHPTTYWIKSARFADAAGFKFRAANSRITLRVEASERIRDLQHQSQTPSSKPDQSAMLHPANHFNLQPEILSCLRSIGLAHDFLSRIELASTRSTSYETLWRIAAKKTSPDRMVSLYRRSFTWQYHYRGNRNFADQVR
jgi:hypothetical protein